MRWPIRNQILVPFVALLLLAVLATAWAAAWLAGRRVERRIVTDLNRVIRTLSPERAGFPLSANVLTTMQGLSGAEFVVLGETGARRAATLDVSDDELQSRIATARGPSETLRDRPSITHDGARYYVVAINRPDVAGRPITLAALYPAAALEQARWEAMLPPVVSGAVLLVAMIVTAAWLAGRTARRIDGVQEKVARIADGDFETLDATGPEDEIRDLSTSINRMAARLRDLQDQMTRSERARLLGQLAGGLAHQLRNAATGARLALQLHRKRHTANAAASPRDTESLDVALQQLTLIEEQIKALLSLGSDRDRPSEPGAAGTIVDDVANLVRAACEHEKVTFEIEAEPGPRNVDVADAEGTRSALLNLVLNGIEAAGPGGDVLIVLAQRDAAIEFDVYDSGPGPSPEIGEGVFEPFVTTKPEGVGLGLALVRSVAERAGGRVSWSRNDGPTCFRLSLPCSETGR